MIKVIYEREGKENEVEITLLNENGNTHIIKPEIKPLISVINAEFRELTEKEKKTYGVNAGFVVEKINATPLLRSRIRPGFIITSIGGEEDIVLDALLNLEKMKGRVLIEGFYPTDTKLSYFVIVL
jgi:hypothetical protein